MFNRILNVIFFDLLICQSHGLFIEAPKGGFVYDSDRVGTNIDDIFQTNLEKFFIEYIRFANSIRNRYLAPEEIEEAIFRLENLLREMHSLQEREKTKPPEFWHSRQG